MATFRESLRAAARAGLCTLLATNANVVALLERTGLSGNPLAAAAAAFRLGYCNNPSPPTDPPPFTGGQCAADYTITYTVTNIFADGRPNTTTTATSAAVRGPIVRVETRGAFATKEIYAITATGESRIRQQTSATFTYSQPYGVSVARVGGGADNCGNLPSLPPPPTQGPITTPISIIYNDNNNTSQTLNATLIVLRPTFSPTFSPTIPIQVDVGGLTFNGEVNLNGEVDIDFDFNNGESQDGIGDPPQDDPDDGPEVIVGARVDVVADTGSTTTVVYNGSNPNLYLPRAGTLQFLQPAGTGLAWSSDISIKTSPQWIPCGPPGFATKIATTPTTGVTLAVTAVYGKAPRI